MEKTAGILVDYDLYRENKNMHDWLKDRFGKASLVALVTDPDVDELEDHDLWSVIIKNHKGWNDESFKTLAMLTLTEASNIIPVIAIDDYNDEIYVKYGVLIQMDGESFG